MKLASLPGSLALLVGLSCSAALPAQSSEAKREIKFIKGLAKDWGFVQLASDLLEDLRKAEQGDAKMLRLLAQVDAEVSFQGSKRIRDLDKREAELKTALEKFDNYLAQYGRDEDSVDVLKSQSEVCEYYGNFLSQKLEITKDPDKRKEDEGQALEVFIKGVKAANEASVIYDRMEKGGDIQAKIGKALSGMRKAALMILWAKTIEKDRKIKAEEALLFLEDMILEFGEETAVGVNCLLYMGEASDVLGRTDDAISYLKDTITVITDRLKDTDLPVSASTAGVMWQILESGYQKLTDIRLRQGDIEGVTKAVAKYNRDREKLNAPIGQRFGDLVLLNGAQADYESGEPGSKERVIEVCKQVARRHPGDPTGLRARGLLNEILSGSSADVGADALFEAAQGDYQEDRYQNAIRGFKRVLRNLDKKEDQEKLGLKSYALMGMCFIKMERYLEAYYAFYAGLEKYGRISDESTRELAIRNLKRAAKFKRNLTKDPYFDSLKDQADIMVSQFGTEKDKNRIAWDRADDYRADKKYDQAIENYRKIEKSFPYYELAQVRIAICQLGKEDEAAAKRAFEDYYKYTKDPLNEPTTADGTNARATAMAEAKFFEGSMVAEKAFGRNGKKKDPSQLPAVVTAYRGYRDNYPAATDSLKIAAASDLISALVELEKLKDAEAEYKSLRAKFPDSSLVSNKAKDLYMARKTTVEALAEELEKVDPKDRRAMDAAEAQYRTEVDRALSFAKTYVQDEAEPDFAILRSATKMAWDVEKWEEAEYFLKKTWDSWSKDKSKKSIMDRYVRPELAEIKLKKGDFRGALADIEAALKVARGATKYQLLRFQAQALGGWAELGKNGRVKVVYGRGEKGDFKRAYDIMFQEYDTFIKQTKPYEFTYAWYQWYFECMDLALKAAKNNSDYLEYAKIFWRKAKSVDDFAHLRQMGKKGETLFRLYEARLPR